MDRGYVKLWRKSLDAEVFCDPVLFRLWSWCLMKTTYKQRSFPMRIGKGIVSIRLEPGQFVFGRNKASEELFEPPSSVWKRMKKLELRGMLSLNSNNQYTVVTICNWAEYQQDEHEPEQVSDKQGTSKEQVSDKQGTSKEHIQEGKEREESKAFKKGEENNCPHLLIVDSYNSILGDSLSKVKQKLWNGTRKKNLTSRWKEDADRQSIDWWNDLFAKIKESSFLTGDNDRAWTADLGWIVNQSNMTKIIEGKYNDTKKQSSGIDNFQG